MIVTQVGIAVCGLVSIYLMQDLRESRRRWGPVFGMISQPFWLTEAYTHQQWGIFILACFYTMSWGRGLWNYWVKPWLETRK